MESFTSDEPSCSPPERLRRVLARHERWLRQVLAIRSGESTVTDELFQELAISALKAHQQTDAGELTPAWLYTVAVTTALLHRRRMGRRRRMMDRFAGSGQVPDGESIPDPLGLLLAKERQKLVQAAIGRLLPKDRELLVLKYTEGWSYAEISSHLGLTEPQVTTQLHRARAKLRSLLSAHVLSEASR